VHQTANQTPDLETVTNNATKQILEPRTMPTGCSDGKYNVINNFNTARHWEGA